MKNSIYKVKELKVDKYLSSYKLGSLNHCKLHFFIEEIQMIGNFNVFTLGTSECAFYALKNRFKDGLENIAYSLNSSEVIFGDLSKVKEELEKFVDKPNKTIILMTCIPSIMNLDLNDFLLEHEDQFIFFSIPEFSGYNSLDYLEELYYKLFSDIEVRITNESSTTWEEDNYTYQQILEKLTHKTHIVKNYKYLKLLRELSARSKIEMIDKCHFDLDEFMDFVNSKEEYLNIYTNFIKKVKKQKFHIISSYYYYQFMLLFRRNNIFFDQIVLHDLTKREVERLKDFDLELEVIFTNEEFSETFDTSGFEQELYSLDIHEALIEIMRRY